MTNETDFDLLARRANESGGAIEALDHLFGAAFALPQWHFIARGALPDINPYIAANADYADGQNMIRAFTDTTRLQRFARENSLTALDGSVQMLDVPFAGMIDYLEQFITLGVHGIWFNSDIESDGFFIPLKQLRPISDHLEKLNLPGRDGQPKPLETAVVIMRDGLMLPSGFVKNSTYICNCFCRLPADCTYGGQVKESFMEKLFQAIYGKKWREGNSDGSKYVVPHPNSKVFTPEEARAIKWGGTLDTPDNHFFFFITTEKGELKRVSETAFQTDIDSSSQTTVIPPAANETRAQSAAPVNQAAFYVNSFRHGSVKPDTSLTPFFRAVAPLLENYAGSGEFTESFSPGTGDRDMSDLFEDITSNAHGSYLKYRSYLFRRLETDPQLEVKSIGSNRLTNLQTGEKLIVHFALHKNLEDFDTKLIVRFLGRETEIARLSNAVKPALEDCAFKIILESHREPTPEALKLVEE